MKSSEKHAWHIQQAIQEWSEPAKSKWLESYVKHNIQSRCVGIPIIRKIVQAYVKKHNLLEVTQNEQLALLDHLMASTYTEDKLAAILYVQLYGKNMPVNTLLPMISHWFDQKWISDWNVCDWLCVRLLTPLLDQNAGTVILHLSVWNHAPY